MHSAMPWVPIAYALALRARLLAVRATSLCVNTFVFWCGKETTSLDVASPRYARPRVSLQLPTDGYRKAA